MKKRQYNRVSNGYNIALNLKLVPKENDFYFVPRTEKEWMKWYRHKQKKYRVNFYKLAKWEYAVTMELFAMPWLSRKKKLMAQHMLSKKAIKIFNYKYEEKRPWMKMLNQ